MPALQAGMRIGELARRSGVKAQTIRFYEQEGLLEAAARTSGNYRDYSEQDLVTLRFAWAMRDLGFDLTTTRALCRLALSNPASAESDRSQLLTMIEEKAARLERLREAATAGFANDAEWARALIDTLGRVDGTATG